MRLWRPSARLYRELSRCPDTVFGLPHTVVAELLAAALREVAGPSGGRRLRRLTCSARRPCDCFRLVPAESANAATSFFLLHFSESQGRGKHTMARATDRPAVSNDAHPRWALALLVCSVGILHAMEVFGYSLPNHERLTTQAVALLEECRLAAAADPDLPKYEEILISYNLGQDELLRKAALWHFPGEAEPQGVSCPTWLSWPVCTMVVHRSFEPWIDYLDDQIAEPIPATALYPALGAALHYVQDSSVPPHAVPVFHPAGLQLHDQFDAADDWRDLRPAEQQALCAELDVPPSIRSVVEETLRDTRQSLADPIGQPPGSEEITWSIFWPDEKEEDHGFAPYGCGGDSYGDEAFDCCGQEIRIEEEEYRRFTTRRAHFAIVQSARLLLLTRDRLKPCGAGSCEPQEGDEAWLPSGDLLRQISSESASRDG